MTDYKQICHNLIAAIDAEAREHTLGFELLKAYAEAHTALAAPMDDLRQASADASGVEVLSPAAQAILDAAVTAYDDEYLYTRPMTRHAGAVAAAALRVAADQVPDHQMSAHMLYAIADELEGQQ